MAKLYKIKCPECGCVFRITKGVLMSWDFSKPIPKELLNETPFNCPECNHKMSVQDEGFNGNVLEVIYAD